MPENSTVTAPAASVSSNGFPSGDTIHTPGPWKIDDGEIQTEEGGLIGIVYSSDSFPCLDEDEPDYDKIVAEYKANARLIKTAPRLLAALRQCEVELALLSEMFPQGPHRAAALAEARATIAEATTD